MTLHTAASSAANFIARWIARGILFIVVLGCLWFVLRIVFAPISATAASSVLYPQICLGGWGGAGYASREPSVAEGAAPHEYTRGNAAYLAPDLVAPIFCSGFNPDASDLQPQRVVVKFHWVVEEVSGGVPLPNLDGTTYEVPEEETGGFIIPALEVGGETSASASEHAQERTPKDTSVVSEPSSEAPLDVPAAENPSAGAPESAPAPVAPPASESVDRPAPEASAFLRTILALLSEDAHAESVASDAQFLIVSYSLDGISWHVIGNVSETTLHGFRAHVPVSNWEDIRALQFRVEVAPSTGHPGVLLDSVELAIEFDTTFSDVLADQVASAASVAESAFDFVSNLADSALALFERETETPPETAPVVDSSEESAPIVRIERRLTFEKAGLPIPAKRSLQWYTDEMKEKAAAVERASQIPVISIKEEGTLLQVSGSCTGEYFVVLTFREASDYNERPQMFASNYADHCINGAFTYDMRMLPLDTPGGTYYLLLADQNAQEAWIPSSALVPIEIGHRDVTIEE